MHEATLATQQALSAKQPPFDQDLVPAREIERFLSAQFPDLSGRDLLRYAYQALRKTGAIQFRTHVRLSRDKNRRINVWVVNNVAQYANRSTREIYEAMLNEKVQFTRLRGL